MKIKDLNMKKERNQNKLHFKEINQRTEVYGIPMQRWFQLAVVFNGRYIDIYIDTVLKRTIFLDNIPIFNQADLKLGKKSNNPNGFVGIIE